MNNPDQRIAEAMECCRPGDLERTDELPELQEAADRVSSDRSAAERIESITAADRKLSAALHSVAPPSGLAERIAAAVTTASSPPVTAASPQDTAASPPASEPAKVSDRTQSLPASQRSRWIAIATVAAILLLAATPLIWPSPARSRSDLVAQTPVWKKAVDGATYRNSDPPLDRPPSKLLSFRPSQVAVLPTGDDVRTTTYRYFRPLSNPQGEIYVFVVKTAATGIPSAPPATPDFDSGGIRVGVWSENGLVYALVVLGDDVAYDRMVQAMRSRAA